MSWKYYVWRRANVLIFDMTRKRLSGKMQMREEDKQENGMFGGFVGWDDRKGRRERGRMRAKELFINWRHQGAALACKDLGGRRVASAPSNQPPGLLAATTATLRPCRPNHSPRYCPVHRLPSLIHLPAWAKRRSLLVWGPRSDQSGPSTPSNLLPKKPRQRPGGIHVCGPVAACRAGNPSTWTSSIHPLLLCCISSGGSTSGGRGGYDTN